MERDEVLIVSLFSVGIVLFVCWWLRVLRPMMTRMETRIDALEKASVFLKLNMEGVGAMVDNLDAKIDSRYRSGTETRRKQYCDLVNRHNILVQKHALLIEAIECLPPVVGERYNVVWDGVTDLFDRMLKTKYEVVS